MKKTKQTRLEAAGWRVGSAEEFLELSPEEVAFIEVKLVLSQQLRARRRRAACPRRRSRSGLAGVSLGWRRWRPPIPRSRWICSCAPCSRLGWIGEEMREGDCRAEAGHGCSNVLRLSCGANSRSGTIQRLPYRRPGGLGGPPAGARGAGSFKRLLGCGLCRWETSHTPAGTTSWAWDRRIRAAPPVPTIRPGLGCQPRKLGPCRVPGSPASSATEPRGGAPDWSSWARGGANSLRTVAGLCREPIQTLKRTVLTSLEEPG